MKHFTFSFAVLFLLAFSLNAQKDNLQNGSKPYYSPQKAVKVLNGNPSKGPLSENFDGTFPATLWSLPTGDADWMQSADVDHTSGSGNSAVFDCYNIALGDIGYLQTPELAVTSGDVTFTFWVNYYEVGTTASEAEMYVDISTDGGATYTLGTTDYVSYAIIDTWTQYTIDLTANIGQDVTLRFRAISDYGYYNIAVDDVAGPALNMYTHDLGIASVTPAGLVLSGSTVAPKVSVMNYGSSTEATYSVLLSDGGSYSQTVSNVSVNSLASVDLTFPNWTPANGNYTLTATMTLAADEDATNNTGTSAVEVRAPVFGDVVMEFVSQTPSAVGVETDGTNIYVQHWNDATFERYDMNGTYINTFTVAAASSIRDLAFDGTYFYGAANSTSMFQLDFTAGAEALVSTITVPSACRSLAFDIQDTTFWGNSGTSDMVEFDMTGTATGRTIPAASFGASGIYGAAYDIYSDSLNPTVWGSSWTGEAKLIEWGLDGAATGREIDLTANYTTPDGGGLAIYKEGNYAYLLADFQTNPNTIVKIFLKDLTAPVAIEEMNAIAQIYPNPADAFVTISVRGTALVTITDMTGRVVISKQISGMENVSTEGLSTGVYVVNCNKNGAVSTSKLIIK